MRRRIGEDAWQMILGAVREGRVDMVRMEGMARRLGGVGRHWARRDQGGACDEAEMRMVLSDWFEYGELNSLSREKAVEGLIQLFEDPTISLLPVAKSLKDNLAKRLKDIDKILMNEIIKPEDPGKGAKQYTHVTELSDFAQNLAYAVDEGFGREFQVWASEDRNRHKGSRMKVRWNKS